MKDGRIYKQGEAPENDKALTKHQPETIPLDQLANKPDHLVTELEITSDHDSRYPYWLFDKIDDFAKSNNPLIAIEIIINCHEAGLYPPRKVLDWLVEGFNRWHEDQGGLTMDSALALKKSGFNIMKNAIVANRKDSVILEMDALMLMFDVTVKEASEMVESRIQDANLTTDGGFKLKELSDGTLFQYMEEKSRIEHREKFKNSKGGQYIKDTPFKEKKLILANYPMVFDDRLEPGSSLKKKLTPYL